MLLAHWCVITDAMTPGQTILSAKLLEVSMRVQCLVVAVFGMHRGEDATLVQVAAKKWWPTHSSATPRCHKSAPLPLHCAVAVTTPAMQRCPQSHPTISRKRASPLIPGPTAAHHTQRSVWENLIVRVLQAGNSNTVSTRLPTGSAEPAPK